MRSAGRCGRVRRSFKHLVLIVVGLARRVPFYFMITTAFKEFAEATATPPTLFPTSLHPENYAEVWSRQPWARYFANTVFIAGVTVFGEIVIAVLAAYAFAQMNFRGKNVLFALFLATYMMPGEATLIPNFVMMSKAPPGVNPFFPIPRLNLYDTYAAQILPFLASAFSVFLLRQQFLAIPKELRDAAVIDGAGHLRFLWSIVLPISVPALVTVGDPVLLRLLERLPVAVHRHVERRRSDPIQVGAERVPRGSGLAITIYSWRRRRSSLHRSSCFISSGSASWCRASHEPASADSVHAYLTPADTRRCSNGGGGRKTVMTKMRITALLTTAGAPARRVRRRRGPAATPAPSTEADIEITGPVTLTLWHALTSDPQKGALEASVKKFNETNGKGITDHAGRAGQLHAALSEDARRDPGRRRCPELVHAYESQVADYTKAAVVIDLDPYVNSKKNGLDQASKDDIYKPYFDTNRFPQYGNQLLSFPFSKSLAVMYTNEDVLKAAGVTTTPKTWADWEQAVMKATKKDAARQDHAVRIRGHDRRVVLQRDGAVARRQHHVRRQQDGRMGRQGGSRDPSDDRPPLQGRLRVHPDGLRLAERTSRTRSSRTRSPRPRAVRSSPAR